MKFCATIISVFICFSSVFSQSDFAPGYIVTVKNDTVLGDVKLNLKDEMEAYVKIQFRETPEGRFKQQIPSKIHAYGVEDRNYKAIKIDGNWVFMQVICRGKITLLEYKPPVYMGNEKMQSLYFVYKDILSGMEQIFPDSKVKKQLKPFISDDKEFYDSLSDNNMHYNEMLQAIMDYNERHSGS